MIKNNFLDKWYQYLHYNQNSRINFKTLGVVFNQELIFS